MRQHYNKDGLIECDFCTNPAVRNYQKAWVVYEIDKIGEYDNGRIDYDLSDPSGEDNIHCCEEHDLDARHSFY